METKKVRIASKIYEVLVATTPEERLLGLKYVKRLPKGKGMLFAFPKPGEHEMWMEDTYIALEQVFINAEQEVTKVVRRVPLDRTLIGSKDTLYVLEVNPGSGIQEGDYLEFDDEIKDWGEYKMKVLAPDGSYLFALKGGERIFSRVSTRNFLKKAKKAAKSQQDKDYAALGRAVFYELNALDSREPEYVNAPE